MSQSIVFNASPTGARMSQVYRQGWGVAAHDFAANKHALIAGCFSDTDGGDDAARENARFIAQMLNLREETGLTGEQIRAMLLASPKMQAAIGAAIDSGMVPASSAKDGGAGSRAAQVLAADAMREALATAQRAMD